MSEIFQKGAGQAYLVVGEIQQRVPFSGASMRLKGLVSAYCNQQVRLFIGGRAVAYGQLIQVDGTIRYRIENLCR